VTLRGDLLAGVESGGAVPLISARPMLMGGLLDEQFLVGLVDDTLILPPTAELRTSPRLPSGQLQHE
jgi:hypothetical protein